MEPSTTKSHNIRTLWIIGGIAALGICVLCLFVFIAYWMFTQNTDQAQEQSAEMIPTIVSISDDLEQMVSVPAGEFNMGTTETEIADVVKTNSGWKRDLLIDGLPNHKVYLSDYSMDKYEVTNDMFAKFVAATQYQTAAEKEGWGEVFTSGDWIKTKGADWKHPRGSDTSIVGKGSYPVVQVSWLDADTFCKWAGKRLPTEAEWEKAARGTDGRLYPWGNNALAGDLLNFADKRALLDTSNMKIDDGYKYIAPVGSYPKGASPFGVLDMAGNVYEWTADWYSPNYYSISPAKNPVGPSTGELRVKRGGAWISQDAGVRAAYRDAFDPKYKGEDFGFRCVR